MTDRFTVHAVVVGLIAIALAALGSLVVLAFRAGPVPSEIVTAIVATLTGALGALAGLLAHTSSPEPADPHPNEPSPAPLAGEA